VKAVVYSESGGPDVLRLVDLEVPEPGPGEVRVRMRVSGVNPTDWKRRRGGPTEDIREQVPNQDGAGVIDAVGPGVDQGRVGQRVWVWQAAYQRSGGTAQEYAALPERLAVPLPDDASFDLGASLGVPALTAHRALTVADGGPAQLAPGALAGRTVLVAGGAGAVGNAAIQLARWAGARVLSTVSSPEKAELATAAGAQHVINYRTSDAAEAIRAVAPDGVHLIVEVAVSANAALDEAIAANNAAIAFYADDNASEFRVSTRAAMAANLRWQGVLLYTIDDAAKDAAVRAVRAAVEDGAIRVGEEAGLPLHRFSLEEAGAAHAAVENHAVGKVLIDIG
jgi:NADPH2:quinone reductase